MNFKTTILLLVLVGACGLLLWQGPALTPILFPSLSVPVSALSSPDATARPTALIANMSPASLTLIEIRQGNRSVRLERSSATAPWILPGNWPARQPEVNELVQTLTTRLISRFVPITASEGELAKFGLDKPLATVRIRLGKKEHTLELGKGKGTGNALAQQSNPFSAPTYARLDGGEEIFRLAPGVADVFLHGPEHYMQRRLFPSERFKDARTRDAVERLAVRDVKELTVKSNAGSFTLAVKENDWELIAPVRDHLDPDRLQALREAIPDIWAESFVDRGRKDLADFGLSEPEQTITLTSPAGVSITLLVGKPSRTGKRTITRPAPPGMPVPPQLETINEEYRYAKLKDNDQIFEIKADKPNKEVFVSADSLRDPRLARFRTEDVRRVEIARTGQEIVLTKEKDRWRMEKPLAADGEASKITDLLDKLTSLQARDKDIIDKRDAKVYGLEQPSATVRVTVEEETTGPGNGKAKKTRTFTFQLGKHEVDKKKLYVRMAGTDRINAVEDDGKSDALTALVNRPALAYRGRRALDFPIADVKEIEVQRGDEKLALVQKDSKWQLSAPVQAEADASKANQLARSLSTLEVVEYVSAKPEAHGLDKPSLSATIKFRKEDKPAVKLLLGKQRGDKPEFFGKLNDGRDEIFVVRKEIHDVLDQGSLAYRPQQLWPLRAEDIALVRIKKTGQDPYSLVRKGNTWQITGPFEANASANRVGPLEKQLAELKCERYEKHTLTEPATYGLDKPYLQVVVTPLARKEGETVKEYVLDIGNECPAAGSGKAGAPATESSKSGASATASQPAGSRYARLQGSDAVMVISGSLVRAVDQTALDLLDPKLLTLDPGSIDRFQSIQADTKLTIQKEKEGWRVVEAPAAPYPADSQSVADLVAAWSNLYAQRYAAYGPKADLAKFGLDKPSATLTVTIVKPADAAKPSEPRTHSLRLGKPVEDNPAERYARLDDGPGIVVLSPGTVRSLVQTPLDFVDRLVFKIDSASVAVLERQMGEESLVLTKGPEGWELKSLGLRADDDTVQQLIAQLASLRAKRVAAYPAKALQDHGLEKPIAAWTLQMADKNVKHVLKIGNEVDEKSADRFAQAEGSQAVVVLPETLSRRLLGKTLTFRDRQLARFADADRIHLERGSRKAVFAKVNGIWKMIEPTAAPAEQTDLEDLLNAVARLRADELVAEKPEDVKPYGLDKPLLRWRFLLGDKELLNLTVGAAEKIKSDAREAEGPRRYARLAEGDLVFLLDARLSARVVEEYRSRTIWDRPLDAAQIESVSFGYDRNPFTIEKREDSWRSPQKPGLSLKSELVNDTLAALAGLRVARYVVDKDADLKLYGLQPPKLVLEIRSPAGTSKLHIGNTEGDSKRCYAHLPAEGRTDVFVLSEDDTARIVRKLTEFGQ